MPHRHVTLAQLRIATPCTRDFDAMPGDARRRFCDACNQPVHDLSQLSTVDAERLLLATAGDKLCVRYNASPDGSPQTLDYAPRRPSRWGARYWLPVSLAASAAAAIAQVFLPSKAALPPPQIQMLGGIQGPPAPQPIGMPVIMGDIAPTACPPSAPSDEVAR